MKAPAFCRKHGTYYHSSALAQSFIFSSGGYGGLWAWVVYGNSFRRDGVESSYRAARRKAFAALAEVEGTPYQVQEKS